MSIHVIVDGSPGSRQCWDFTDGEYERALYMFEHLVYEGRTKGILLRDGKRNDEVWLKRILAPKSKSTWRKFLYHLRNYFTKENWTGNRGYPTLARRGGRGPKPPAS